MNQAAQRTDTFAHIRPAGAQEVAHRVVQAKHGCLGDFESTIPSVDSRTRYRSGHEARSETAGPHLAPPALPKTIP